MSSEVAISVRGLSKHHLMFARPEDRLKQMVVPRLQRLLGRPESRYFRDFAALTDVSFDVRRGEAVGIVGRNGSGKSTLLQIICGTLQPSTGTATVNGRVAALLELGAGFNPDFTGRENVFLNAAILGLSQNEIESRYDAVAAFADIGEFIEQPVKTYSSGMYVRLAFATAINVDPDILVVDEALAVGDEAFQRKCFARIEQIREDGGTILFVSHSTQTIVQLCDRAILLDRGHMLLEGRPKLVTGYYQRLSNASPEMSAVLRAELSTVGTLLDGIAPSEENELSLRSRAARYNPAIQSQSTISYVAEGATISNIRILDDGLHVNEIWYGAPYELAYDVTFSQSYAAVGFGMLIKTKTGVEIGGQASHWLDGGIPVNAGETVTVSFPFVAHLLPGSYFCNVGVSEHHGASFRQLHRVLDGLMFQVLQQDWHRPVTGIVGLSPADAPVRIQRSPK